MKSTLIMMFLASVYLLQLAHCGTFQIKLESVAKEGKFYTWTVQVENISKGYNAYFVHRPDAWGKAKFYSEHNGKPSGSVNNNFMVAPSDYEGVIIRHGDKLTFKYKSEAKDGSLVFSGLGEILPIYKNDSKVKILLSLWISDFDAKTCRIENLESDWVNLNFPFDLSKPPEK